MIVQIINNIQLDFSESKNLLKVLDKIIAAIFLMRDSF